MLVERFLALDNHALTVRSVPAAVWEMFAAHRWPGNVRELRNAVQRLVIAPELSLRMSDDSPAGQALDGGQLADEAPIEPLRVARRDAAEAFERRYLEAILKRTGGNVTRAAAISEVSRQMIQKLMRKHDIA
jgi:DNA-binding NtrC family response regulator